MDMSSLDKQSVRAEFDTIKASFKKLSKRDAPSPEMVALINALFLLFNIVLSIFLEKHTKKTSANSSIPSSQSEEDETTPKKKGKSAKQKKEKLLVSGNTRTVETVEISQVLKCKFCGCDLSNVSCAHIERRTQIDIIFEKTVVHVDAEVKNCPSCSTTTKGSYPSNMPGPLQYGNGIKSYVIQLLVMQMMSLNRVSKMLVSLIGNLISEATLLSYLMKLHLALEPWETSTKETLISSDCINVDETSLKVNKTNNWIHVHSSGDITLKFLHKKRGKEAIEGIGIIPKYEGVIVHDCWASYLSYKHCSHGLCGSHLLRELAFIIDVHSYKWARNMKRLLKYTCRMVAHREAKCLNEKSLEKLYRCYEKILAQAHNELPEIPRKTTKRRGKIAKSDAHNLCERLQTHKDAVLLFAKLAYVSFTNNRAERDLRMSKVKQKVSGCFRVEKYAKAYCRISSYLQTMKNKGINPMIAVELALEGKFEL